MVFYFLYLRKKITVKQVIQVVAFNIPYPPDYGGVIDVFYKIKALSECGVSVILHCFEYNRPRASELEKYCEKVYYYQRKKGLVFQLSPEPYIVITRANDQLITNLSSNSAPVLFEGIHTCHYLNHPLLVNHVKLVRTHNIEHEYYLNLYKSEKNLFKRMFFRLEARKLRSYEPILKAASHLLSISPSDCAYFSKKYGYSQLVQAFHPYAEVKSKPGRGKYILFHGNLSVAENIQAVDFLLEDVLGEITFPMFIAGKNPNQNLVQKVKSLSNVQLISNPSGEQMEKLIEDAHICLLPTFQSTGIKLKLLASLFSGRYCIANSMMTDNTGLEHLCHTANTPRKMVDAVIQLFDHEFTEEEIAKRKEILARDFSNHLNALKIVELLG